MVTSRYCKGAVHVQRSILGVFVLSQWSLQPSSAQKLSTRETLMKNVLWVSRRLDSPEECPKFRMIFSDEKISQTHETHNHYEPGPQTKGRGPTTSLFLRPGLWRPHSQQGICISMNGNHCSRWFCNSGQWVIKGLLWHLSLTEIVSEKATQTPFLTISPLQSERNNSPRMSSEAASLTRIHPKCSISWPMAWSKESSLGPIGHGDRYWTLSLKVRSKGNGKEIRDILGFK